jgi:hypothetical protein
LKINNLIIIFIISLSLLGTNCKSTQSNKSQKKVLKSIYVDQFRLTYIRKAFLISYNNSEAIKEIINNDRSGFTEIILTLEDYKFIDSLCFEFNEKLKIDSIEGKMRAEGSDGKRPLGFILNEYGSKWLDSIAKKRYKISEISRIWLD